jgi:serine/threonine-protein kinase RsbT
MSTKPAANPAEREDVLHVAGPVRRVVTARVENPELADDVVQETLARLLEARWRLDREALVAYGIVTARNLVTEHDRTRDVERRNAHRLVGAPTSAPADDGTLAAEEHAALRAGLGRLDEDDRRLLVGHAVDDVSVAKLAAEEGITPGALAARLARARARLRVEHLLAFRRTAPASPRCRPVLEALSLGDRRRQSALHAGEHLLDCGTCGPLSEPLLHRRRGLAAIAPIAVVLAAWRWVKGHAGTSAAAATATAAAAVGLVSVLGGGDEPPQPRQPSRPPPVVAPVDSPLVVAGEPVPLDREVSLRPRVGHAVVATRAPVFSVPADEGFWVGTAPGRRVWVQMSGSAESPQRVRPGAEVTFRGQVVALPAGFAARVGLRGTEAAELTRAGAYVSVSSRGVTAG